MQSDKKRAAAPPGGNAKKYRQAKPAAGRELGIGMRGVLLTCEVHVERQAIKECVQLLEQLVEPDAAEAEGGPASSDAPRAATAGESLARELQALKRQPNTGGEAGKNGARFSVAQTGCSGNVFVRFSGDTPDPRALIDRVMERGLREGHGGAPHIVRMVPIEASCAAKVGAIVEAATPLLQALRGHAGTYAVHWRRKCNSTIQKMEARPDSSVAPCALSRTGRSLAKIRMRPSLAARAHAVRQSTGRVSQP